MDVKTRNRADLKAFFVKNSIPTQSNFADLIDGMLNQRDDGLAKASNLPLSIEAAGAGVSDSEKKAIALYQSFADSAPAWTLSLNPRTDPKEPKTAKLGFAISDGEGRNRLFIDRNNGNVGIGTTTPGALLEIKGGDLLIKAAAEDPGDIIFQTASGTQKGRIWTNPTVNVTGLHFSSGDNTPDVTIDASGFVGVGTSSPIYRLDVKSKGIKLGLEENGGGQLILANNPNDNRIYLEAYSTTGTESAAELLLTGRGATPVPQISFIADATYASGRILAGNSDLYFTKTDHQHSGIGNTAGYAAIENAANYDALMILGRAGTDKGRKVKLWDYLQVNGTLETPVLQLGDKWRLSAVGDFHANDDWLRMLNITNTGYYGGLAAGKLWTTAGQIGSDLRMKTDVHSLEHSLEKLLTLRGVRFKWQEGYDCNQDEFQFGLIAQEVETVFPEVVGDGPNGLKSINYSALIAPLIESVKHLQGQIVDLQAQIHKMPA